MTVSELYKSVASLGFESTLPDSAGFYYSLNRALLQVNALRPTVKSYVINHNPLPNKVVADTFLPLSTTGELCFEAEDVKSYYFEIDGAVKLEIERKTDNGWELFYEEKIERENGFKPVRGLVKDGNSFLSDRVRLHFKSDYFYSVRNVAMYPYLYSKFAEDVPAYGLYSKYDLSKLTSDFLELEADPIIKLGEDSQLLTDFQLKNDRIILLPRNVPGLYEVTYKHRPVSQKYTNNPIADNTSVDLDEELASLLPLLLSSYVWADDEPEKAQYYGALYRENAADVERRHRNPAPIKIENVNGWA